MNTSKRWLLPDGVQETLPPDAAAVERLRHDILNVFHRWGYDLVMPAMIEYMDSLLTGTAHSLDTRTFALVDQLSGKQMGGRSDMTPQVARIDARHCRIDLAAVMMMVLVMRLTATGRQHALGQALVAELNDPAGVEAAGHEARRKQQPDDDRATREPRRDSAPTADCSGTHHGAPIVPLR